MFMMAVAIAFNFMNLDMVSEMVFTDYINS